MDSKKSPVALLLTVMVLVGLGLTGCGTGDKMADLRAYVSEVKARPVTPIEPLPEIKPYETYAYQVHEMRDPFEPPAGPEPVQVAQEQAGGPQPDPNRPREPLEMFPLDSLRMVGILEREETTFGLVKARDGTLFRVREGNYLGQNHGKILRISEQQIDLMEIVPNGTGGWMERSASLALNEK